MKANKARFKRQKMGKSDNYLQWCTKSKLFHSKTELQVVVESPR